MPLPTVTLNYQSDKHQFTFEVQEAKEFTYQLNYELRLPTDQDEQPSSNSTSLLGKLLPSSQNLVSRESLNTNIATTDKPNPIQFSSQGKGKEKQTVVILAGSESSGHQYFHDPKNGTLTITITNPPQLQYKIVQEFTIDKQGKLSITQTQIASESADQIQKNVKTGEVLGSQSPEITQAPIKTILNDQQITSTRQAPSYQQIGSPTTVILISIITGIVATIVWLLFIYWKKQHNKPVDSKIYFTKSIE